jgi:hypothetical protein
MSPTDDEQLLLEAAARLGDAKARRELGPSAPPPLSESAAREWPNHLRVFGQDELLRATAAVVRSLLLPQWAERRPNDSRPRRAVEAAELWLKKKTPNAVQHASVLAKACTTARRDSFGYEHRIAEAARAIANAPAAARGERFQECLAEALEKAEEHINSELYVKALYGREKETRARIADALRSALLKT